MVFIRARMHPQGQGSGSMVTTSVTSSRSCGWTRLYRLVTSSRAPGRPGGTGCPSASTFSTSVVSSNRWMPWWCSHSDPNSPSWSRTSRRGHVERVLQPLGHLGRAQLRNSNQNPWRHAQPAGVLLVDQPCSRGWISLERGRWNWLSRLYRGASGSVMGTARTRCGPIPMVAA